MIKKSELGIHAQNALIGQAVRELVSLLLPGAEHHPLTEQEFEGELISQKRKPPLNRRGLTWDNEENDQLEREFRKLISFLAQRHGRSTLAIQARIRKNNLCG